MIKVARQDYYFSIHNSPENFDLTLNKYSGLNDFQWTLSGELLKISVPSEADYAQFLAFALAQNFPLQQAITLYVTGMTCASCESIIQNVLAPEGIVATASAASQTVTLRAPLTITPIQIKQLITDLGFATPEREDAKENTALPPDSKTTQINYFKRALVNLSWGAAVYAIYLLGLLPAVTTSLGLSISLALSMSSGLILYATSKDIFQHVISAAWHRRPADMNTLLVLGTSASWLLGFLSVIFPTAFMGGLTHHIVDCALILGAVNLGRGVRANAEAKARSISKTIEDIYAEHLPKTAIKVLEKDNIIIPRTDINVGNIIEINASERIVVDGILLSNSAIINNEPINGESKPKRITKNELVSAGGINLSHNAIQIQATTTGNDSKLSLLIQKLALYQKERPSLSPLIDTIAKRFIPIILSTAWISAIAWVAFGPSIAQAFNVFLSIVLCACPCALNVAAPFSHKIADSKLAKLGIYLKNAQALEKLLLPKTIFFDKTGTLTALTVQKDNIYLTDQTVAYDDLIQYAASVELGTHPIAVAIRAANINKPLLEATPLMGLPAKMIGGQVENKHIYIGHYTALVTHLNIAPQPDFESEIKARHEHGFSTTCVAIAEDAHPAKLMAIFSIQHELREDAKYTIDTLKARGLEVRLLTGDDKEPTLLLAQKLHIPESHVDAGLSAEQKETLIQQYQSHGCVVMVGDGVNDTLALGKADVGIALHPDDPTTTTASIILNGKLSRLIQTLEVAQNTAINIKQNLSWAFLFNFVSIGCAILGLHNPIAAGLLMAFSSAIVIANATRLHQQKITLVTDPIPDQSNNIEIAPHSRFIPQFTQILKKSANVTRVLEAEPGVVKQTSFPNL